MADFDPSATSAEVIASANGLTAERDSIRADLEAAQAALRWLKPRWSALGGDRIRLDVASACLAAGADMLPADEGWYAAYRARVETDHAASREGAR